MRNEPEMLEKLRRADWILSRANCHRPHGYKSCLRGPTGGREPSEAQIRWAQFIDRCVNQIADHEARTTVLLSMLTQGGEPIYTRSQIASAMRVSESTVTRKRRNGLKEISDRMTGGVLIFDDQLARA